jgi:hypothetical protein
MAYDFYWIIMVHRSPKSVKNMLLNAQLTFDIHQKRRRPARFASDSTGVLWRQQLERRHTYVLSNVPSLTTICGD